MLRCQLRYHSWLNYLDFLINQVSCSKNGLQPELITYDASVDAEVPNQSLMLSINYFYRIIRTLFSSRMFPSDRTGRTCTNSQLTRRDPVFVWRMASDSMRNNYGGTALFRSNMKEQERFWGRTFRGSDLRFNLSNNKHVALRKPAHSSYIWDDIYLQK